MDAHGSNDEHCSELCRVFRIALDTARAEAIRECAAMAEARCVVLEEAMQQLAEAVKQDTKATMDAQLFSARAILRAVLSPTMETP